MRYRMEDVLAELDHVDRPDALDEAKTNHALRIALEMSRPQNWHGSGLTPDRILPLAIDDGIPVAWVPPTDVLKALVAAPQGQRRAVLLAHEVEVLADCRRRLLECDDPGLDDTTHLLTRAFDAFDGGHPEAAMALAVSVGEPLALWASVPRVQVFDSRSARENWERDRKRKKYKLASMELDRVVPGSSMHRYEVSRHALIAPVKKFFTEFRPGDPKPDVLSRHVVAHAPTPVHFSRTNALLALMLATSILREQQDWSEEVRATDSVDDA